VEWSVCGTMCDVCWPSGGICAVSGSSRDVRGTQPSVSVWYIYTYMCIYTYIHGNDNMRTNVFGL